MPRADSAGVFRLGTVTVVGAHATARVALAFDASVEAGVRDALDRNYAPAEAFPEPGRTRFVNLTYGPR